MTRTHGRCPRGERLVARTPFGRWRTLTFLAALRCDRLTAPCVIDGPINGVSFRAYVEQVLVPTLNPGDIVVMDNLASHKGRAVRASHPRRQSQALFLARLLARSQSHRTGLRQNEDLAPQSRRPNNRQDLANHRRPPRLLHPHRMRQLLQKRRICFSLTRSRSLARKTSPLSVLPPRKNSFRVAARPVPRPLGRAEACRGDHIFDLDGRRPLAAHGLRRSPGRQAGRTR